MRLEQKKRDICRFFNGNSLPQFFKFELEKFYNTFPKNHNQHIDNLKFAICY